MPARGCAQATNSTPGPELPRCLRPCLREHPPAHVRTPAHALSLSLARAQGVSNLVKLIFSKSKPKRFGDGFMSGPVLAGLVEAYVKAMNDGAVPTIATAWQVRAACWCPGACAWVKG